MWVGSTPISRAGAGTVEWAGMTISQPATADHEIRLTVVYDAALMTTMLRAFPQVNRARWRQALSFALIGGVLAGLAMLINGTADAPDQDPPVFFVVLLGLVLVAVLAVVGGPWWMPRLKPRSTGVGLSTHWRLNRAGLAMTGERGAVDFRWQAMADMVEKDGYLMLLTAKPMMIAALPLDQLDAGATARIRGWLASPGEDPVDAGAEPSPSGLSVPSPNGLSVLVPPLAGAQAWAASRGGWKLIAATGFLVTLGLVITVLGLASGESFGNMSGALMVMLIPLPLWLVAWAQVRRLLRDQPYAGNWTFDAAGFGLPGPHGPAKVPWSQVRRLTVRRGLVVFRVGPGREIPFPVNDLPGTDLEQIQSWAAAAYLPIRS